VVAGAFQIAFRAEMHANDVFLFFKNYFWHQYIKTIQKVQTALNFNKKKIQICTKRRYKRNTKRSLYVLSFSFFSVYISHYSSFYFVIPLKKNNINYIFIPKHNIIKIIFFWYNIRLLISKRLRVWILSFLFI
jgi:hypothetical protein